MSTPSAPLAPEVPAPQGLSGALVPVTGTTALAPRASIGRRSIRGTDGELLGYELVFEPGPGLESAPAHERDRATSAVVATAFGDFGLHRIGHRRNLFVNLTRELATGAAPMPFGPHNVVLEVLGDLEVDHELVAGIADLRSRGYRVAVDANVSGPAHELLLPLVDVVKLDVQALAGPDDGWGETSAPAVEELEAIVAHVRSIVPQALLLADRVADRAALERVAAAGFDLVQGYEPRPRHRTQGVHPSQTVALRLLAVLSDEDSTAGQIEQIVAVDPGLSVRVLTTVNSAAGAGRQIASLRQALGLLGRRQLSAWVLLAALGGHAGSDRGQMIDVLARARCCELLHAHVPGLDPADAYTVGMLHGVVEQLGVDAAQLAREARLAEPLAAALLHGEGPLGEVLEAIVSLERDGTVSGSVPASDVSRAQLHALGSAVETVDAILGTPA
ncbi:EAL and HDOD domain-containing protein [Angustibacter aerolatus]